jgi:RND family efflux transporter MFP subunit
MRSLPLLLLLTLLLTGCGVEARAPSAESAAPAPVVDVARATQPETPIPVHASGRLASKAEIQLAFKIDGVIDQILVDEGNRVDRGAPLARLNLSEIDARVTEAESALDQARRDRERTARLYRDSVATLETLQNARTAVDVAEARVQAAQFNRRFAVIDAPEGGRVLHRHAEEGEYVRPGTPILTLGAVDRGWVVRVGLPAEDVVRTAIGDSARVVFDAYPAEAMDARVTEIADAAEARSGTFEVELSVPDPADRLKSGFIGRVTLFPSLGLRPVEIPADALVSGDGSEGVVFRVEDATGTVRRQIVQIARIRDSTLALSGGLVPGDRVVTTGAPRLSDGDSVRVAP